MYLVIVGVGVSEGTYGVSESGVPLVGGVVVDVGSTCSVDWDVVVEIAEEGESGAGVDVGGVLEVVELCYEPCLEL